MEREKKHILREELSRIQHDIWTHWMSYLFSVSIHNDNGTYTIPADQVARWNRQIVTPYNELPEMEKDGDREQADKILTILSEIERE